MRYRPALTGIRGVGVLLVVWTHASFGTPWALPGGFLGVDLFFVLSGFLITGLLVSEQRASGTVALRAFYARRALRLLPALLVTLALVLVLRLVVGPVGRSLTESAVATVFYLANWLQVVEPAETGYLDHAWSLSIEEQFYLFWPFVLALALRRGAAPAAVARWLAASAVVVLCVRWGLHHLHPGDPVDGYKLYYTNTFARADGLLLGAALALLGPAAWRTLGLVAPVAAVAFGVLVHLASLRAPFLYDWGFTAVALSAVPLVAAAATDRTFVARCLAWRPVVALGEISYGVYLLHFPIVLALSTITLPPWLRLLLGLLLPLPAAVLSYVLVERKALAHKHRFEPVRAAA